MSHLCCARVVSEPVAVESPPLRLELECVNVGVLNEAGQGVLGGGLLLCLEGVDGARDGGVQLLVSGEVRVETSSWSISSTYLGLYLTSVAMGSRCLLESIAALSSTTGAATTIVPREEHVNRAP